MILTLSTPTLISMSAINFFYYTIGIGFLILIAFLSFLVYETIKTLRVFRSIMQDIKDITTDVQRIKNGLKSSLFENVATILGFLTFFLRRRR